MTGDEMHKALFQAIADQALLPGTPLREQELADAFGINRPRARELLLRMNLLGVVEMTPFKTAQVAKPSPDEAKATFEARRIVESGIVSEVAARLKPADLARLRRTLEKEALVSASGNRVEMIRQLGEFHLQICAILNNPQLSEILSGLVSRTALIEAVYPPSGLASCDCENHRAIFQCLEVGDREGAVGALLTDLFDAEAALSMGQDLEKFDVRSVLKNYRPAGKPTKTRKRPG